MSSYICHDCGVEHDTVPKAMECARSHTVAIHQTPPSGFMSGTGEGAAESEPPLVVPAPPAPPEQTMPEPKAAELLGRAARHMHDRASTYDKPEGERSMGRAVKAFNAISGKQLTESEGWLLLQVLKDVRNFSREKPHQDSLEDCIAYSALKAEAEMRRLREWEDQRKT